MNIDKPAFPVMSDSFSSMGLTRRELFAAMAMSGLMSRKILIDGKSAAEYAVCYADALIAALSKQP